ncbi:MAG: formylmethanofuran dehydrogenase subunit B [Thermoproteota archaeon]|nr:formylmethanofuran dehydrogenase subunit B [Candidatus Korarchaeota archaeon]RLG43839.1 MAG: formylmethanofuran dehydrogenase subunit B [Candidatus Korarchaeota archaeon]
MIAKQTLSLLLNTGRTIKQGISMEAEGKLSEAYADAVARIELNEDDMKALGITDGSLVEVISKEGSIKIRAFRSKEVKRGHAYVPMGPWANMIVDPQTMSLGMPNYKYTIINVRPSEGKPTSLIEILAHYNAIIPTEIEDIELRGGSQKVYEYMVCPFCGELCDHLKLEVVGNEIKKVIGGCANSVSKLRNYHKHRILRPLIREGGHFREVSLEEALRRAARILSSAKYPLLFGWSSTVNEAIRVGVELAEILRGVIDNTSVVCHGPTALGAQDVGTARSTLGIIRHKADYIVIWGSNPSASHQNHFSLWIFSRGKWIKGRKNRKVVVIDVRETPAARLADELVRVEPGKDYELITALRMAVRDLDIELPSVAGVPTETIYRLADEMKSAKYGVIFEGMGITMTGAKHRNVEELIKLAHDLNEWTRFVLIPMRGHYNVTGSDNVFLWTTGYPFGIDFSRGYPRMVPGVTTAPDLLMRGEVDAALIISSDPVAHFPKRAVEHLSKIPVITIDPKWSLTATISDVIIPSGIVGVECGGTAYRLDDVPLRIKSILPPPPGVLCDDEILRRLLEMVKEYRNEGGRKRGEGYS